MVNKLVSSYTTNSRTVCQPVKGSTINSFHRSTRVCLVDLLTFSVIQPWIYLIIPLAWVGLVKGNILGIPNGANTLIGMDDFD